MAAPRALRIAICGGPASGKSTLCDVIQKERGKDIAVIPEVASMLFRGGFPRFTNSVESAKCLQRAVFTTQREFEDAYRYAESQRIVICDRGALDGAVFWPEGRDEYFSHLHTTHEAELARYDAVLFLDTAAKAGLPALISDGNPFRVEDIDECLKQHRALEDLYRPHMRFYHVPVHTSMMAKLVDAQATFYTILRHLSEDVLPTPCG